MSILEWLLDALASVATSLWPNSSQHVDRSVVGESRLDRETRQLWGWVGGIALIVLIGVVLWLRW